MRKPKEVPIWERALLTVEEAADYTGIGINRLRSISQNQQNGLILFVGSKKMFKRKKLEEYLDRSFSVQNSMNDYKPHQYGAKKMYEKSWNDS